ncbi:hypothetical protein KAZ57_02580 [Patescibacteria group bacterium]|nr:hypothetical protein [Patescibacteria group bacterium]
MNKNVVRLIYVVIASVTAFLAYVAYAIRERLLEAASYPKYDFTPVPHYIVRYPPTMWVQKYVTMATPEACPDMLGLENKAHAVGATLVVYERNLGQTGGYVFLAPKTEES